MLPYRVYLPQELKAMSPPTGGSAGGALPRLVRRGRLRQPAPGTI